MYEVEQPTAYQFKRVENPFFQSQQLRGVIVCLLFLYGITFLTCIHRKIWFM